MSALAERLRTEAIHPALLALEPTIAWTQTAENFLLNVAAHESGGFLHRVQIGGGPARGLWQMEHATFADIYGRYLDLHPVLKGKVDTLWPNDGSDPWAQIETNDRFACALARVKCFMSPKPLNMDARDIFEMGRWWGSVFNTHDDPAMNAQFVADVRRYVEDVPTHG